MFQVSLWLSCKWNSTLVIKGPPPVPAVLAHDMDHMPALGTGTIKQFADGRHGSLRAFDAQRRAGQDKVVLHVDDDESCIHLLPRGGKKSKTKEAGKVPPCPF